MEDISKVDPRLVVQSYIGKPDVRFFAIDEPPFKLHGAFREGECYRRVPEAVSNALNSRAKKFSTATAGARVRFKTNSAYVAIRAHLGEIYRVPMLTLTSCCGFDLYEGESFLGSFNPPYEIQNGGVYEAVINLGERRWRELTVNMPMYSSVIDLWVGVDGEAELSAPNEYSVSSPVVFYGSSITHGACASRPGMTFSAMLSRRLDCDYINLGFGAGCRGDLRLAEYIGGLRAGALVCAYDHNAPNPEKLKETHKDFYEAVRKTDKSLPIIFVSRPETAWSEDGEKRRNIIKETYLFARELGDNSVYFIDGRELLPSADQTHDGIHPNDLGQESIAKGLYNILDKILNP